MFEGDYADDQAHAFNILASYYEPDPGSLLAKAIENSGIVQRGARGTALYFAETGHFFIEKY